MKIQKVAALCKSRRHIEIVDSRLSGELRQYIGDGTGLYFTGELPEVDDLSIFPVFDVPPKMQEKYMVQEYSSTGLPFPLSDKAGTDAMVERAGVDLVIGGDLFIPIFTSQGLRLLEARYLSPFDDADEDHPITLWERTTKEGELFIVVKIGFLLNAVIEPLRIPRDTRIAIRQLEEILCLPETDPATGEVTDDE